MRRASLWNSLRPRTPPSPDAYWLLRNNRRTAARKTRLGVRLRGYRRTAGKRIWTMRINQNTLLQGKRVTLVPYTAVHVPRYHEWMKSEELQRLTASEPLTLEQEYEMQCSWREDADKCTFIILDADKWSRQIATEEECMVGDVNLFLTDPEDPTVGEIEIMIAETSYRGKGFGKEATLIMMYFGMTHLGLITFEAKIGLENVPSISMFKKIHFKEVGVNSIFQEVTLRMVVDEQERQWLLEQTSHVDKKNYCHETAKLDL